MGFGDEKLRMDRFASNFKIEIRKGLPGTEIQWQMASSNRMVKYFDYEGTTIWGATAMILHELLIILRRGGIFLKE